MSSNKIPTFSDFVTLINEGYVPIKYDFVHQKDIDASNLVIDALIESTTIFTSKQKKALLYLRKNSVPIMQWDSLSEGFWDTVKSVAKSGVDKAKDVASAVKGKADDVAEFMKQLGGELKDFVAMIRNFITRAVKALWEKCKEVAEKIFGKNKEKDMEEMKKLLEKHKDGEALIKKEAKGIKDLGLGVVNYATGKMQKDIESGLDKVDNEKVDQEDLALSDKSNESMSVLIERSCYFALAETIREKGDEFVIKIMESESEEHGVHGDHGHFRIPFFTTFAEKLEKFPPFNWLVALAKNIGDNINKGLDYISEAFKKIGAIKEATKFIFTGEVLGLLAESQIKTQLKTLIMSTVAVVVPGLGALVYALAYIADGIWYVHMASTLIGGLPDEVKSWFTDIGYETEAAAA